MSKHELNVESNMRYPGGKDGWTRVWCCCDPSRMWWGHNDAAALKPAMEHKKAKDKAEATALEEATLNGLPAAHWKMHVEQWLTGNLAHAPRPDLAELLTDGDHVVLTYRELAAIINAVRINSKQR